MLSGGTAVAGGAESRHRRGRYTVLLLGRNPLQFDVLLKLCVTDGQLAEKLSRVGRKEDLRDDVEISRRILLSAGSRHFRFALRQHVWVCGINCRPHRRLITYSVRYSSKLLVCRSEITRASKSNSIEPGNSQLEPSSLQQSDVPDMKRKCSHGRGRAASPNVKSLSSRALVQQDVKAVGVTRVDCEQGAGVNGDGAASPVAKRTYRDHSK